MYEDNWNSKISLSARGIPSCFAWLFVSGFNCFGDASYRYRRIKNNALFLEFEPADEPALFEFIGRC